MKVMATAIPHGFHRGIPITNAVANSTKNST